MTCQVESACRCRVLLPARPGFGIRRPPCSRTAGRRSCRGCLVPAVCSLCSLCSLLFVGVSALCMLACLPASLLSFGTFGLSCPAPDSHLLSLARRPRPLSSRQRPTWQCFSSRPKDVVLRVLPLVPVLRCTGGDRDTRYAGRPVGGVRAVFRQPWVLRGRCLDALWVLSGPCLGAA